MPPTRYALTDEEIRLIGDAEFFEAKARIMTKVRGQLEEVFQTLKEELAGARLVTPAGFDPGRHQFVKGEHLEKFPYQYLDFPKHFAGNDKFTFRTLFWWGHHVVCALILEGEGLLRYKQNLINRYREVAGRDVHLALSPTPWDWRQGEGRTIPLSPDRRPEVGAVLSGRPFFKLARFTPMAHPALADGRLAHVALQAFRAMAPVIRE